MGWFKRLKEGITTNTKNKKEDRDGVWNIWNMILYGECCFGLGV